MVTASGRLIKHPQYKDDFYVEEKKLFCRFCQGTVDHEKKSIIDNHLTSAGHKSRKRFLSNKPVTPPLQREISSFQETINEGEHVMVDHEKKSIIIDNNLASTRHKSKKRVVTKKPITSSISSFQKPFSEREQFVLDFVQLLTEADISIEKVKYFQPFFMEYCKNGMSVIVYIIY